MRQVLPLRREGAKAAKFFIVSFGTLFAPLRDIYLIIAAMYFIHYAFLCLVIGLSLFFQLNDSPAPGYLDTIRVWGSWGFLAWGGFQAVRVIVDCLRLGAQGQMSAVNARSGILLALLYFLPVFLMSVFLLGGKL